MPLANTATTYHTALIAVHPKFIIHEFYNAKWISLLTTFPIHYFLSAIPQVTTIFKK